ncbi:hypothetical protein DMJ13_18960 [halophilic archaeon]|nr:hypothetical protein DMJ13_18960 [halophilic archaeon]
MTWQEQWPGTPYESGSNPREETSGLFRVALKASACAASTEIATLRDEFGEIHVYESRTTAEQELLDDTDCSGLRFQQPAPNGSTDVDRYLVKVRDPELEPAERGPPEDGWTFNMRAQQVGALAETLFSAYSWNPPPIVSYAAKDLSLEPEDFQVAVNASPESISHSGLNGSDGRWMPDCEFIVHRRTSSPSKDDSGPVLKRYLAEIKHGSTGFERHQRQQMARIADETGDDLAVLLIRVKLQGTPQSYDLTIQTPSALSSENQFS